MPAPTPSTERELKAALPLLFNVAIQCSAYARTFKLFYPEAAVDGATVHPETAIAPTMNAVIDGTLMYIRKSAEFFLPRSEHHREDSLYSYLYPGYTAQAWIIPKEEYVIFHKRVGHLTLEEVRNGKLKWDAMAYACIAMSKWADFFGAMAGAYSADPEIAKYCQKSASVIRTEAEKIETEGLLSRANAGEGSTPVTTPQQPPVTVSDLMSFRTRLEAHFGADVPKIKDKPADTNSVIGALNHEQFENFRASFDKRLERLADRFPTKDPNRTELLKKLSDIGNPRNWPGAYAEVVAIDFFNSNLDYLPEIQLSKKGPPSDTLAGALSGHESDHDGFFPEWGVLFDVKVLSDKAKAILDSIIKGATKALQVKPYIMPEYPLDGDFATMEDLVPELMAELTGALAGGAQLTHFSSVVMPELTFKIAWKGGIQSSASGYNPYTHAENHHTLLFKHAAKFSRVSPSFIVFVVFPWYSEKGLNVFGGEIFYRSFARRFFCQYKADDRRANSVPFLPGFVGPEVVSQISSKLSGIIFIEDTSIESKTPDEINARAFAYLNPNAEHPAGHFFRHHLEVLDVAIDDFKHDNY